MWPQLLLQGGRMAMQALPYITATMGALPGLRKGDLGQAVIGGGLGYLGGGFGAGKLGGAKAAATTGLREAAAGAGPIAGLAGGLKPLAQIGIPLAGAAIAAPLIGGLASGAGGAASRTAGSLVGGGAALGVGRPEPSGEFISPGGAVPSGFEDLTGLPTTARVIDPRKEYAAARLEGELEQDVQLKGMKKMMPYLYQASEARAKSEMERQMAAAQIRQNIQTAANLVQRGQQAAQQMGLTAAQQMGNALTAQYQYQ